MDLKFRLSWVSGFGISAKGDNKEKPSWLDIANCLELIRETGGTVTLEKRGEHSLPNTRHLQVIADEGKFFLSLGEENEEDWEVRTYYNPSVSSEKVCVGGDYWDGRTVFRDFDFVRNVFREFHKKGVVNDSELI